MFAPPLVRMPKERREIPASFQTVWSKGYMMLPNPVMFCQGVSE